MTKVNNLTRHTQRYSGCVGSLDIHVGCLGIEKCSIVVVLVDGVYSAVWFIDNRGGLISGTVLYGCRQEDCNS